jgi:hypothetical protein
MRRGKSQVRNAAGGRRNAAAAMRRVEPCATFGRFTVVDEAEPYLWRGRIAHRQWRCACSCGSECVVRGDALKSGHARSCGCLRDEATRDRVTLHGGRSKNARTPEYEAWQAMLHDRQPAPVCRRWKERKGAGFRNFLEDMGERPSAGHRLVRFNERRSFSPENCAWSAETPRRGVPRRLIGFQGSILTLGEASRRFRVPYATLCQRLLRGWAIADALTVPLRPRASAPAVQHQPRGGGAGGTSPTARMTSARRAIADVRAVATGAGD